MKKIININVYSVLFALASLLLIAGCKKINTTSDLSTPRIFKPGAVTVVAGQTSAKVTWTNTILVTAQKYSYTIQFSKDTLFGSVAFTMHSDTLGVTATDDSLTTKVKYWVRVKTNATATQPESNWAESKQFNITGEYYFLALRELEIKETSATIRFKPNTIATKITLTAGSTSTDYPLSPTEISTGVKVITGLTAGTNYTAEIFAVAKSKGVETLSTLPLTVYTTILNPGADLNAAVAAAANNAVIGLNAGTYDASAIVTPITQKMITIKSTSGNPYDTKVLFKEMTVKGTGAGLKVSGIEFDGTAGAASYFINFTGAAGDTDPSTYTSITVENCYVHNTANCFIRANRAAVNANKIDFIKVTNTIGYNNSISTYDYFTLDKLVFNRLDITKSTFYNISRSIVACPTTTTGASPVVNIDMSTFNSFGSDATKYVIFDASANPITFSMTNCIIANVPRTAGAQAAAIRATAGVVTFSNNDYFKFTTLPGGTVPITVPNSGVANQTIDLGWTTATTDFTLPATSTLRTASSAGGAIGDPRWAY
jgi:hypothetical protein